MNSSNWYIHQSIGTRSLHMLSDRELSKRAAWRASMQPKLPKPRR
jgi:hypothetical protein